MLRDIQDIIKDYIIVGGIMGLVTVIIKPFVSWKRAFRDVVLSFIFSMLCGLTLEYCDMPYAVKVGISGIAGLFAVRLYEIINHCLIKIEQHPDYILTKLKDRKDD